MLYERLRMIRVEIKLVNCEQKSGTENLSVNLPSKQTLGSSGYDLYAADNVSIEPGKVCLIPLGFKMSMPQGWEAQIRSRSGLAFKHQVFVLNSPGTIDSDYRDEVKVLLMNQGSEIFLVEKGMRIAQMIFAKIEHANFEAVEEFSDKIDRGGGFGSTGSK